MKILVDTHIAMWSVLDTDKLPKKAQDINPLTADFEMFASALPDNVFYQKDGNWIFVTN